MTRIRGDDARLTWDGVISVEHTPSGTRGWRLPHERIDLFPDGDLAQRAAMQAGVRVRLGTDARTVVGRATVAGLADEARVDAVVGNELVASASVTPQGDFVLDDLPAGDESIEVWLPQFGEFRLRELTVDDDARVWRAPPLAQRRLVTYGSSITQCRTAASPAQTWPALLARRFDLDLTCLGFGGQCHLDPLVAHEIGALAPDVVTMCVGINIYGSATFSARSLLPAILGFVTTVRESSPTVPILMISPIGSPERETTPNAVGLTLVQIRSQVAEAVRLLRKHGDENLHLLDGLDVLPLERADRLDDGLHPDAEGYRLMAEAIGPRVESLLQTS
ncbi:SGNH/GDSL hydrolase family protein [Georgenia halophila]|uniref:SGNH/GDSL hydrolase family protein n=1 Tax=Georgenia halophila TaxID=620889 RepID=A0ABP8LL18_9MICO